jgi:hypothetical protein
MDKQYFLMLCAEYAPRILELVLLALGIIIVNVLRKQGATKEQIALVEEAYAILSRAARNTNQVWVEAIKEAGGKLSEEEAAKAREDTIKVFKSMITEAMELAIEKLYGSIDKWIEMNLESAVNEVKDVVFLTTEYENEIEG